MAAKLGHLDALKEATPEQRTAYLREHGLPASTLSQWARVAIDPFFYVMSQMEEKLRSALDTGTSKVRMGRPGRSAHFPEVEVELPLRLAAAKEGGEKITGNLIRALAFDIAKERGLDNFVKASNGACSFVVGGRGGGVSCLA